MTISWRHISQGRVAMHLRCGGTTLLQIYHRDKQWKNLENRLRFDKVIDVSSLPRFLMFHSVPPIRTWCIIFRQISLHLNEISQIQAYSTEFDARFTTMVFTRCIKVVIDNTIVVACRPEWRLQTIIPLECGPMPNVMVALPNIGGALCSMLQFGWRPLLECRAVTLPKHQTRWNLEGCPKLTKRSQPLVGRNSPYYEDMWRRYCCLTSFFPIVDTCLSCEDDKVVRWCPDGDFWRLFCVLYLQRAACSRFQTCILNSH